MVIIVSRTKTKLRKRWRNLSEIKHVQTLGQKIKSLRNRLGLSTEEFAKKMDPPASKGTVSKWENNKYMPNTSRINQIAKMDGKSFDEFVYGQELTYDSIKKYVELSIYDSGRMLTDSERKFLIENQNEIINAMFLRVSEFPNSEYLLLYISDRIINIAEYEQGDAIMSAFDLVGFETPYPKLSEDFVFFSKNLSFFNYVPNNSERTEQSFINNKITLIEDLDKQYTQIESDIDESLTLIKTETDEEKIRDFSSQISQGSQVLEHLEEVKLKLISNPEFKFYVHNKVIYLIVNKEELTVDDVKFNASQYDNLIVRKNGEEIVHLTDFDNAVLIDTIKEYHDWNTSIILTINAWFKMIDYTQHI